MSKQAILFHTLQRLKTPHPSDLDTADLSSETNQTNLIWCCGRRSSRCRSACRSRICWLCLCICGDNETEVDKEVKSVSTPEPNKELKSAC